MNICFQIGGYFYTFYFLQTNIRLALCLVYKTEFVPLDLARNLTSNIHILIDNLNE